MNTLSSQIHINITDDWSIIEIITCLNNDKKDKSNTIFIQELSKHIHEIEPRIDMKP